MKGKVTFLLQLGGFTPHSTVFHRDVQAAWRTYGRVTNAISKGYAQHRHRVINATELKYQSCLSYVNVLNKYRTMFDIHNGCGKASQAGQPYIFQNQATNYTFILQNKKSAQRN